MRKGHRLLEDNIAGSCILSNGKLNAKCWWHAGRTEWSDFVPLGEFFTSGYAKKPMSFMSRLKAKNKPLINLRRR